MVNRRQLDRTFSALSDPTRRAILARLRLGDAAVMEIARPFRMSLPAVSKHLKILEQAGLVEREREGRVHRCRLRPKPLGDAVVWFEDYRVFWEGALGRLDQFLREKGKTR